MYVCISMCVCVYVVPVEKHRYLYTYTSLSLSVYIYIYIHIQRSIRYTNNTVSFHSFTSQDFKSSVSNPKNKYVAYLSVLSQISNCQSLGRKSKH